MHSTINVPLESYLLAQQSAPTICLLCDAGNAANAERCVRCSAPLFLSRQDGKSKKKPSLIAVIGAPSVGKTVYLGMLMDLLARQVGSLRTNFHGPQSIELQQETATALSSGWYPDRTATDPEQWSWVHCQVECGRGRRSTDLVFADVSGEVWAEEAHRPGTHLALTGLLAKCSGVMVLADTQRLHAGDHADDFIAMKLLSVLQELRPKRKRSEPRPLALVLTKADACQPCLDDAEAFAESHAESLVRDCRTRFPRTQIFSASAVGASTTREYAGSRRAVPLRVEPQGVVEPLGWLLTNLRSAGCFSSSR